MLARRGAVAGPEREPAEHDLRFGGGRKVAGDEERIAGLGQGLDAGLFRVEDGLAVAEQHRRPLGVVLRPEFERGRVEAGRGLVALERRRTVSRLRQREPGPLVEAGVRGSRGTGVLECLLVVVRARLCVILGAAQRLDPLRGLSVLLGAPCPWDASIGHVTDEEVAEGVFGLPLDGRTALAQDELLALERA